MLKESLNVPNTATEETSILDAVIETSKSNILDATIEATEELHREVEGEFVISANFYGDGRGKWLIRPHGAHQSKGEACDELVAKGDIKIVRADSVAGGYGCAAVALVVGTVKKVCGPSDGLTRLHFEGWGFVTPKGDEVDQMTELSLSDGVWAKL